MNKKDFLIYRVLRPEASSYCWSSNHKNCFRYSTHETDKHIDKKFERFKYWRKQKADVFTEVILKSGLRPDLIIVTENEVFIEEIVASESEKSILLKKDNYPFVITTIKC